jgi:hypothetical protein
MANNQPPRLRDEHPIEEMSSLAPEQVRVLRSRWLVTIEAFVAAAATSEGRVGLCQALGAGENDLDNLLHDARRLLGDDRYRALMQSKPGGPMGALWDEEDHR